MKECFLAGENGFKCSHQKGNYCYLLDLFFVREPIPETLDKDSKLILNRDRLQIMFRESSGCQQSDSTIRELMQEREDFDKIER